MPEKRKQRVTRVGKAQQTHTQKTLWDLFQKTNPQSERTAGVEETGSSPTVVEVSRTGAGDNPDSPALAQAAAPLSTSRPPTRKQGQPPTRLYPIFTRAVQSEETPQATTVNVGNIDVIDILDTSSESGVSEVEVSQLSSHCPSPHSDLCPPTLTASSRPSSPFSSLHDGQINEDELSKMGSQQGEPGCHLGSKKRVNLFGRVGYSFGSSAPLPDSESQHVRGPQHAYVSSGVPSLRESHWTPPLQEGGPLDFLEKQRPQDHSSMCGLNYIHVLRESLTRDEQEEAFKSFTHHFSGVHPAIDRLSPGRMDAPQGPWQNAEMWTHRFRPRCTGEVLGNERHVRFLMEWLRALHLRGNDPTDHPPANSQQGRRNDMPTAVELHGRGVKRTRVIRTVTKKQRGRKKRRIDSEDELDDFIVSSDADEDNVPAEDQSDDEFAFCYRTLSRMRRREAAQLQDQLSADSATPPIDTNHTSGPYDAQSDLDISDNLTNTLLLTGPPGCGKTAAVYACAEELGWEVFEVYSGIGRRNGANIDHLVGDVGKNHIIKTIHNHLSEEPARAGSRRPPAFDKFFGQSKKVRSGRLSSSQKAGTAEEPINLENDSPIDIGDTSDLVQTDEEEGMTSQVSTLSVPKPVVRQSLLLLEEVDILFKEDTGFWTAVIDLIRSCKRPVILTCNDVRLVPVEDLPLQRILVFEPCPTPLAVTFLQCLSLREGCLIPREDLEVLYETTHMLDGLDAPDAPLYPRTEPIPVPDLRRSISQLQMVCTSGARGSRSEMLQGAHEADIHVLRSGRAISGECSATALPPADECKWWRQMSNARDVLSYVNSHLCRRTWHTAEALGFTLSEPSLDDEVGHSLLLMPWHAWDTRDGLQQEELIAEEAILLSRGIHERDGMSISGAASQSCEDKGGFRSRVVYQSEMGDVLQHLTGGAGRLVPQESVFLDYIPWVRYMVEVDDGLERLAWDGGENERAGRTTRNSMRTRHVRNIEVGERERRVLVQTRLQGLA